MTTKPSSKRKNKRTSRNLSSISTRSLSVSMLPNQLTKSSPNLIPQSYLDGILAPFLNESPQVKYHTRFSTRKSLTLPLQSIIALRPVVNIFLKTLLHLNPENQTITEEKRKLSELEQISWEAVIDISKNFLSGNHDYATNDLILKHNLAHFFVKSIETPESIVHEDLHTLIRSCLIPLNQIPHNLIRGILHFIIELEAHKLIFSSTEDPDTKEDLDPRDFLFDPDSGRTQKDLLKYLKFIDCQSPRVGDQQSSIFQEISGAISQEIVSHIEDLDHCKRRFSVLNLSNICLILIRQLVQQELTPAELSTANMATESPLETLNNAEDLTQDHSLSRDFLKHLSSSSSTSDDSDEFQAENLIENPSPIKADFHPILQSNQTDSNDSSATLNSIPAVCAPEKHPEPDIVENRLASTSLTSGFGALPEANGSEERADRANGPDCSGQRLALMSLTAGLDALSEGRSSEMRHDHVVRPGGSSQTLASISLAAGLDVLPEGRGFEERHHRVVGPDSSGQGVIFKQLYNFVKENPEAFTKSIKAPEMNSNELFQEVTRQDHQVFNNPTQEVVDDSPSSNSPIKANEQIGTSTKNSNESVQVNQNLQVSDHPTKELVTDPISLSSAIKSTRQFEAPTKNSIDTVPVTQQDLDVSNHPKKELVDEGLLSSFIEDNRQVETPVKNFNPSVLPLTQQSLKIPNHPAEESSPIKATRQIKTPIKNSNESAQPQVTQNLKTSDRHTKELFDLLVFSSPINGTRQIKTPATNSNQSVPVTQQSVKLCDRSAKELVDPILFSSPIKDARQAEARAQNAISAPFTQVFDHHTKELVDDADLLRSMECNQQIKIPTKNSNESVQLKLTQNLEVSDHPTKESVQVFNSALPKTRHSPLSQDVNPPALALVSGQTPRLLEQTCAVQADSPLPNTYTLEKTSTVQPDSPLPNKYTLEKASAAQPHSKFRFNTRQEDASQISFESFPAIKENPILYTVQSPSLPADEGQGCQDTQKIKKKTDRRSASKSEHNSNNKKKVFQRTISGFLSSSGEDSTSESQQPPSANKRGKSPPLRGKRAIKKAPQSTDNQVEFNTAGLPGDQSGPKVNDTRFPLDQPEDNTCQVASSSRRRLQSSRVSGRSRTPNSSEPIENQQDHHRRHHKKHKSPSTSPSPVRKHRRRLSKDHSCIGEQPRSTPPSPIPVRKRKRGTFEDHAFEHKQISSKNKFNKQKKRVSIRQNKTEKNFWTKEEEKLLIKEVEKYYQMKNCMAHIISRHGPNGRISTTFRLRTSVNLKDKAINLSTRWYTNKIKLSERRKTAFARFPPKVSFQYESESELESDDGSQKSVDTKSKSDEERPVVKPKKRRKSTTDGSDEEREVVNKEKKRKSDEREISSNGSIAPLLAPLVLK